MDVRGAPEGVAPARHERIDFSTVFARISSSISSTGGLATVSINAVVSLKSLKN